MAIRHPTEKEVSNPSVPHTPISLGKIERRILQQLNSNDERFNIKSFSRSSGTPRSTITDTLNRLVLKGFVEKIHYGIYNINSKGKQALEMTDGGVGSVRMECRESQSLSQHFSRFSLEIESRVAFSESRLSELAPQKTKRLKLPNNIQDFAYFEDATIIIYQHQVVIRIYDLRRQNAEETILDSFTKAVEYADRLSAIGIKTSIMELDAHYARSDILTEILKKINDKFFVELSGGRKLWIDFSLGKKAERETNDAELEEKMIQLVKDVGDSSSRFSDIDSLKEISGNIVRYAVIKEMQGGMMMSQVVIPKEQQKLPSYIG